MGQLLLDGNGDSGHKAWQESLESIIISNVPLPRSQIGTTTCDMHMHLYMWLPFFLLDSSLGLWVGIRPAGGMKTPNMYIAGARGQSIPVMASCGLLAHQRDELSSSSSRNTIPTEIYVPFTPCIRNKAYSLILPWYDRNSNHQNAHSFCKNGPQIYSVQCNHFITLC